MKRFVKIVDKKTGKVIVEKAEIQEGFKKGVGFMFRKEETCLFFDFGREGKKINGIHTFFCPFPLKCVFLDKDFVIKEIAIVEPFKLYFPKNNVRYLIEFPYWWNLGFKEGQEIKAISENKPTDNKTKI